MRVGVLDKVKYQGKTYTIMAEWDNNIHVDIEDSIGTRKLGVKRSELEYVSGSHV